MHKEILQKNVADAEREHQAASQEEARLRSEVKAASSKIADLQQRYDSACVQVAQGNQKAENPASILTERDTHGHRLRGLEQMHREASQRSQVTAAKLVEAQTALQAQLETEEVQRLEAELADAVTKANAAKAALDAAEQVRWNASITLDRFRRQLELKAQGRI